MSPKIQNNKSKSARPSVRQNTRYVKNVVTPDTVRQKQTTNRSEIRQKVLSKSVIRSSQKNNANTHHFNFSINDKVKRILIIAIIAIAVITIACIVGISTFLISTSTKLSFSDDVNSKLVPATSGQSSFMLFAIDADDDSKQTPDVLMLTRVDPNNKSFILVNIPILTYVAASYGGGTTLQKIYEDGGDAALLDSISSFSEINISSYVKSSSSGLSDLVDALGGIDVNLKEYVDDINIADVYIPQGYSTLNGKEVKALLMASDFHGGEETVSDNQRQICMGLLKSALRKNRSEIAIIVDKLAGEIKSNMDINDIINFILNYDDVADDKIMSIDVPGFKTIRSNNMVYMINASEWKNLRIQMSYGNIPTNDSSITIDDVDTAGITVEVQNGAGVSGAASSIANKLTEFGYNVTSVGNAESNIYKETLIIYNGESFRNQALAIKNTLNNGRCVDGSNLYNMKSDILFIIGGDLTI